MESSMANYSHLIENGNCHHSFNYEKNTLSTAWRNGYSNGKNGVRICKVVIRKTKILSAVGIVLAGFFLTFACSRLFSKYGSLFYWETYLPLPPYPIQGIPDEDFQARQRETALKAAKILCLVLTSPENHKTRAVHVAATWGRHCGKTVFITSTEEPAFDHQIVLPDAPNYEDLWLKLKKGLEWVRDHAEEFDWVLKADDDTFIFVENLLSFLSAFDPREALVSGLLLRTWDMENVYTNGGASYVLSSTAVSRVVDEGFRNGECQSLPPTQGEDVNLAQCLASLRIRMLDSRDEEGRHLFHVYPPQALVDPRMAIRWEYLWLRKLAVHPYNFGLAHLSNKVISFHYVDATMMYLIYYLTYFVRPFNDAVTPPVRFEVPSDGQKIRKQT